MKKDIMIRRVLAVGCTILILCPQVMVQAGTTQGNFVRKNAKSKIKEMQRLKQPRKQKELLHRVLPSNPKDRLIVISDPQNPEGGLLRAYRMKRRNQTTPDLEVVELQKSATVFEQAYRHLTEGSNAETFLQAAERGDKPTVHDVLFKESNADVRLFPLKEGDTWESIYWRELDKQLEKLPKCREMCTIISIARRPEEIGTRHIFSHVGYALCLTFCK